MRKVGVFLGVLLMLIALLAIPAAALVPLDSVDIGDLASEAGHFLRGWGPIEPETSGGIYGGVLNCRCTWEPGAPDTKQARAASFMLKAEIPEKGQRANSLRLLVLDGFADDSFEVYVRGKLVHSYDDVYPTETWVEHVISLPGLRGRIKVEIIATGPAWSGFATYGQLAVDYAELLE